MKIFDISTIFLLATACAAPTADKPATPVIARKSEDPGLLEHRRLMAEQANFQKRFLAALPQMHVVRLYYIDPMPGRGDSAAKDQVQGYLILSRADLSAAKSSTGILQGSLRKIIESQPEYGAACFDPHHVVTLSDGKDMFDAVVCFDCSNYRIFSPRGDWLLSGSFDAVEEPTWDKVFTTTGLKRPLPAGE